MEFYDWLVSGDSKEDSSQYSKGVKPADLPMLKTAKNKEDSMETQSNAILESSLERINTSCSNIAEPPDSPPLKIVEEEFDDSLNDQCANDAAIAKAFNGVSRLDIQKEEAERRRLQMIDDEAIARCLAGASPTSSPQHNATRKAAPHGKQQGSLAPTKAATPPPPVVATVAVAVEAAGAVEVGQVGDQNIKRNEDEELQRVLELSKLEDQARRKQEEEEKEEDGSSARTKGPNGSQPHAVIATHDRVADAVLQPNPCSIAPLTREGSKELLEKDGSKRLDHSIMSSIRRSMRSCVMPRSHRPKVNPPVFSPEPVITADRARLIQRLKLYGLAELETDRDGNCQFRSLSDQLYRNPHYHDFVRRSIVQQLKDTPDRYRDYVPEKYEDYLERMAKPTEWGDHVTLQAAADHFGTGISILTSFEDDSLILIQPDGESKSERVLWLAFWAEVHYNSVYPEGEAPKPQDRLPPLPESRRSHSSRWRHKRQASGDNIEGAAAAVPFKGGSEEEALAHALELSRLEEKSRNRTVADPSPALRSNPNLKRQATLTKEEGKRILEQDFSKRLDKSILRSIRKKVTKFTKNSVKHKPRTNSLVLAPEPVITADRARVLERLKLYGLSELEIDRDGNCQFRSLSDQLFRNPYYHEAVRESILQQLKDHPDRYQQFVPDEKYEDYLERMAKPTEWGDHVTLQAAADHYGTDISILTSFEEDPVITIQPDGGSKSDRVLWLAFWAEVHYNSVYPEGEAPKPQDRLPPNTELNNKSEHISIYESCILNDQLAM